MATTYTAMTDRNVAYFTMNRKEAARLVRLLADAIAESDEINMEFRTDRCYDYSKADGETIHEIRLGIQNSIGNATGRITESATWADASIVR
jgi:hypothetical protein